MSWKKSKDGGLDYDVSQETQKQQSFNPYGSAHTMTFNFNNTPLPVPKSRKEEIKEKIMAMRRARIR